jgi:hypothetical protein
MGVYALEKTYEHNLVQFNATIKQPALAKCPLHQLIETVSSFRLFYQEF